MLTTQNPRTAGRLRQTVPRDVTWYGDPAGAREIMELRCAGVPIRRGDNEQRPGIAAVRARLEDGSLRVVRRLLPQSARRSRPLSLRPPGPRQIGDAGRRARSRPGRPALS